jgi:hypothetical protein
MPAAEFDVLFDVPNELTRKALGAGD